jgi:hypothetical protein
MNKRLLLKKLLVFAAFLCMIGVSNSGFSQVYLSETFDAPFTGAVPAPANWTQTRFNLWSDGTPAAITVTGPKDWEQNFSTGTSWTKTGFAPTNPNSVSGNGVMWIEDYYYGTTTNSMYRRMESPAVNLSSSTSPFVKFKYFCAQTSNYTYPLVVVASNDNGATWKPIMHVQPNAAIPTTGTTAAGTMTSASPWSNINVKVPAAYKVSNAKFGLVRNAAYSFSANLFIDSFSVEEFTPTTITSAGSGLWSNPATWVGGIVPNADNHVVVDVGHIVDIDVNIARTQDVTVNGTLRFYSSSLSQVLQAYGNMTINTGATYTSNTGTVTTSARWTYLGGNLTNEGTVTVNGATTTTMLFTGGTASVVSGAGTYTGGFIPQIYHQNSAGTTYNSAVVVRNAIYLVEGSVNPNGNLTVGLASPATAVTIIRNSRSFFTARPLYPSLGTLTRNVYYGGTINGNMQQAILTRDTIFTGFELDSVSNGEAICLGTMTINTMDHIRTTSPVRVGSATVGGATTFSRGIVFTSAANPLIVGQLGNGSAGIAPTTTNPPLTAGSYVVGPIRFDRNATAATAMSVPIGVGGSYLQSTVNTNHQKTFILTPGGAWNNQTLIFNQVGAPGGTVDTGLTTTMGDKTYFIDLNGGTDIPTTSTITLRGMNYLLGNSDNLYGNVNQLFVGQSSAQTGAMWKRRSLASATTTGFVNNTIYTFTSTTATPYGPIAPLGTNGGYFTFVSNAGLMTVSSTTIDRTIDPVSIGSANNVMLRVKITAAGQVPKDLTQLNFNTNGTSRLTSIASARVYFTGSNATFGTATPFGSVVNTPSGAFAVSGNQTLAAGDNYFWLVYNVSGGAVLGDSLAAQLPSFVFNGATSNPTAPAAGYRIVSAPMTFVSASAAQSILTKVEQNSTNNQILDVQIVMSATGAPIPLTQIDLSTNGGGANPTNKIANAKLYYSGASNTFSTANLIGTTVSPNGAFNITGNVNLLNGTNYLWVTYDIVSNAPIGDSVDCEATTVTIGGTPQSLISAPAGVRIIRAPYCSAGATSTGDEEIWNVTFGTLNNTSNCTSVGGPGSTNSMYNNYTALPAPNIPAGLAIPMSILGGSCGGNYGSRVSVYIDLNQDGDFLDAGEMVLSPPSATSSNSVGTLFTGTVTLPCSTNVGLTRMRVVYNETTGITPSCGTFTWGEVEDYTINIVNAPASLNSTTAMQVTGNTSAGTLDVPVLRVPVRVTATPCLPGVITELRFNTAGTTTAGDIVTAKLYKTGTSATFATTNLVGSITAPSGQMIFTIADTVNNDTNNYWLAYDVSATAANNNVLDARYDSVQAFGAYYLPVVSTPAGNRLIATPMSYVSSNAIHTRLDVVETGSTNNVLMRILVRTSSSGSPINATQLNLSTNGGGIDTSNISAIKIWYTGASSTFAAVNQFGTNFVPVAVGASYSVSGLQSLLNDTNYFWVTYDIKPIGTAIVGDSVDAELTSIVIAGNTQIPTVSAPAGIRKIRQPYCASAATTTADGEILNVTIGSFSNTSTCAQTGGPGSTLSMYSNYSATIAPINIVAGLPTNFSIHAATCGGNYSGYVSIFIDLNNDGDFTDVGENVHTSPSFTYGVGIFRTGSFTIPCTATSEPTRMRVMLVEGTIPTPCLSYGFGETEDYTVTIVNSPASYISSSTVQNTGTVSAGTLDVPVLRVPVKVSATPCLPGIVSEFRFTTTGTTAVANISSAKLYTTGSSTVFNTNKLLGTVTAPSGQFVFTVSDTVVNDTNNYWLAYDVASNSANGNFLDARVDSLNAFGSYYIPSGNNPTGNLVIATPMTYSSSDAIHPVLSKVETNSFNNQLLRVIVNTSATGAAINATQLNLSTNGGGIDTSNIGAIKVWYTGTSSTFAATSQFGSTYVPVASGAYSVSGTQPLVNGANYFWVTYDIKGSAILGDSVDAEIASVVVGGVTQVPTTTAPVGRREIRSPYCASAATTTFYHEITNVTFGTLNNTSTCASVAPGLGSVNSMYGNYQSLTAPNIAKGLPVPLSVTGFDCSGFALDGRMAVYVDLNQNGLLTDPGELVFLSNTTTQPANSSLLMGGNVTIPCTALNGPTLMRVVYMYVFPTTLIPAPCGTYTYGETEDYTINIVDVAPTYVASNTLQITGSVGSGTPDVPVLRIPVKVTSSLCNPGQVTEFRFKTTGTTAIANITAAKLYTTGASSVFGTAKLLGSVSNPSTSFTISVSDTAINDTNNYWLAYDVAPTASNGNFLDGTVDSINVYGTWIIPSNTNPAGNRVVAVPMSYVASTTAHTDLSKVETNSSNNIVLRVLVQTSAVGAPINVTQLNLSTNGGGVDTSNVSAINVWYSGSIINPTASQVTQFGSSYVPVASGAYSVSGTQALVNGDNYFWVTYNIKSTAILGDSIDGELTSVVVGGNTQTPTVSAPVGRREIRAPYCPSAATSTADEEIWNVTFGTLNNTTTCTSVGGPGSNNSMFNNYTALTAPIVYKGSATALSLNLASCGGNYGSFGAVYIDYNQNGQFTDAGEMVYSTGAHTSNNLGQIFSGSVIAPLTASSGTTRMRVIYAEVGALPTPCLTYTWGETEDYTVDIQDAPFNNYVWTGSTSNNYATASNWTPSRTLPNSNDKLTFNSSASITNVQNENIRVIEVANAAVINLTGASGSALMAKDTVSLGNGSRIRNSTNFTVGVGVDTSNLGTLIVGTSAGVSGNFRRWTNSTNNSVTMPLIDTLGITREVSVAYTTSPTTYGSITVGFTMVVPGNTGLPLTDAVATVTANRAGINGYWTIVPNGIAGGEFTGTFNATGFKGVNSFGSLILLRRAGTASAWNLNGTHSATLGTNAAPIVSRTNMTQYGQYAVGGDTSVNPLPVSLIYFSAKHVNGDVNLDWATASEINNKGFIVERSLNGENFEQVGEFVKGAGNSRVTIKYADVDFSAFAKTGVSTIYYRLKQIDFDGEFTYSNVVAVSEEDLLGDDVKVFPNPFVSNIGVSIESSASANASVNVIDMQGRVISTETVNVKSGNNYHEIKNLGNLTNGVYFIKVSVNGLSKTTKVTKTN